MGDTKAKIGDQVRKLRTQMGLTQQQLAFMVGLSREQVNRLENGTGNPGMGQLDKILDGLGCPIERLFDEYSWQLMGLVPRMPDYHGDRFSAEQFPINYRVM